MCYAYAQLLVLARIRATLAGRHDADRFAARCMRDSVSDDDYGQNADDEERDDVTRRHASLELGNADVIP